MNTGFGFEKSEIFIIEKSKNLYILLLSSVSNLIDYVDLTVKNENDDAHKVSYQKELTSLKLLRQRLADYDISYCDISSFLKQKLQFYEGGSIPRSDENFNIFVNELTFCIKELERCEIEDTKDYLSSCWPDVPSNYVFTFLSSKLKNIKSGFTNFDDQDKETVSQEFYEWFALEYILEGIKKVASTQDEQYYSHEVVDSIAI